jgi:hypothetical protein
MYFRLRILGCRARVRGAPCHDRRSHPLTCMAGSWSGPSVSSTLRCYMNQTVGEGFPSLTSSSTMPFLNMFRSKRSRSRSTPAPPDRSSDVDGSEFYDQEQMYHRPRASSGLSRSTAIRGTQLHDGSRAQRYPSHGPSFHNSGYPHSPSDDEVRIISPSSPVMPCS